MGTARYLGRIQDGHNRYVTPKQARSKDCSLVMQFESCGREAELISIL